MRENLRNQVGDMIFSAQTEKLGKAGVATIDKSMSDKEGILSQGTKKASLLLSK